MPRQSMPRTRRWQVFIWNAIFGHIKIINGAENLAQINPSSQLSQGISNWSASRIGIDFLTYAHSLPRTSGFPCLTHLFDAHLSHCMRPRARLMDTSLEKPTEAVQNRSLGDHFGPLWISLDTSNTFGCIQARASAIFPRSSRVSSSRWLL